MSLLYPPPPPGAGRWGHALKAPVGWRRAPAKRKPA